MFTGLRVLDRPQGGILLQLGIAHRVQSLDLRDSGGTHLLKFLNKLRVEPLSGQLIQNILPFAKFFDLAFQVLHQGFAAHLFLFLDLVEKAIGAVKAIGAGVQSILILVIQRLDVLSQPVVDGFHLIGIFLFQIKPLLVSLRLNTLNILDVLLLSLTDLLLQAINFTIHFLALVGALGIPALHTLIGRKLIGKAHAIVVFLFLDPVHGVLVRGVHQLIP